MDWLYSSALLAASDRPNVGFGTLAALVVFILASMWIGMLANKAMQSGTFMKGFFLGNRGLGAWALALTATVQSGGTFMGFPARMTSPAMPVPIGMRISTGFPASSCATLDQSSPRSSSASMSETRSAATSSPTFSVNVSSTCESMISNASSVLIDMT